MKERLFVEQRPDHENSQEVERGKELEKRQRVKDNSIAEKSNSTTLFMQLRPRTGHKMYSQYSP